MTKTELRKHIRTQKSQYSAAELVAMSEGTISRLLPIISAHAEWHTILLYHSLPDEVHTHNLIAALHAEGKHILLPSVVGSDIVLHEYISADSMKEGDYGISESTGAIFTDYAHIDVAIIPGMAFTPDGHRLGRGKGYYDRLLRHLHCPKIGIALPFQVVDNIPHEPHDIMMDRVIY